MRAALARGQLVDLVDDHRVDRREQLALRRREQEVERLGGRDEDVGRRPQHLGALGGGRVAGADRHFEPSQRRPEPSRSFRDARERRAEVALDVDRERLQRRHVEDAQARAVVTVGELGLLRQPIDGREERRERLARAGGRKQERGVALRDMRPCERLRARRLAERSAEPLADGGMKRGQRIRERLDGACHSRRARGGARGRACVRFRHHEGSRTFALPEQKASPDRSSFAFSRGAQGQRFDER